MNIGDAPEKINITVPLSGYLAISQMSLSFRISIHNPTWDIKNLPYKYKGCRWLQTYFIIMSEISVLLAHAEQAVSSEYHLSMALLQKLDNYFTGIWRTHLTSVPESVRKINYRNIGKWLKLYIWNVIH